ncbi:MAG: hypothetical protein HC812_17250 [Leptolyngbya sp. RL_3_1]|nr:hypothetical protein [Leptolyngbya sp. RL_3_1]
MPQEESLDFKLVQRVCLLQQALDQALYSLEDLKEQVQNQQWLESQLATTEKYANVQEQAIAYLKSKLTHLNRTQPSLLQHIGDLLDDWVDQQQSTLNRLQFQIQQGETELQSYLQHVRNHCQEGQSQDSQTLSVSAGTKTLELESEVMVARSMAVSLGGQLQSARYYIQTLAAMVHHHHADLAHLTGALQTTLSAIHEAAAPNPPDAESSEQNALETLPATVSEDETTCLRQALRVQQVRIYELETALADQFGRQAQLKQRCQTLAAERDYYKRQVQSPGSAIATEVGAAPEDPESVLPTPWQRRRRIQSPPSPIQPLQIQGE